MERVERTERVIDTRKELEDICERAWDSIE